MSCPLHGIWTPLKHWYLFLGDTGPVTCLDGWVLYIDHCYKIFRETKGWEEALTSCQKEGSHLASIQSLEEHSFLVSQLGYSECFGGGGGAFAFVCMWEAPASAGELQLRCSNCINMKHCSQRRAKSQRSSGVRRVQCSASCFKTEATFGAATCRLNQLSWLVLCFAEGRRTSVIPVRSFLGERIMKYNFHFARVLFMENQRICTAFYAFGELTVWL